MKLDFSGRFRRMWDHLRDTAAASVKRFGKQTEEVLSEEPIDYSAPSIPYYENLANRFSFTRVVLYMTLFVFVVVTVVSNHDLITYDNLYFLVKDIRASTLTAQSEADQLSYPVSSVEADFTSFRGGLVAVGSEVVTALSGSGRQTLSVNVAYAAPRVRASDRYFLTFGRGEYSFSLYNSFVQVHKQSTEYPIYDAAVADNGSHAILTRSRDYTSEVLLYDGDMEPIANYHLNGYVTGLAFNSSGSCLAVVSVESGEGLFETTVTLIRIGNRIYKESVTFADTVGSTVGFTTDERVAVIFSDRMLVFKPDATIVAETLLEDREPLVATISGGRIALVTRPNGDLTADILTTYDHNGRKVYELRMAADHPIRQSGGVQSLACGGGILYLRTADRLYRLDANGKNLKSVEISRTVIEILPTDDGLLLCTPAYAARLSDSDFH